MSSDKRRAPRCAISIPCSLHRDKGSPFDATTVNLGPGGVLLKCGRPLSVDEFVDVDIDRDDLHIEAHARVLRHEGHDTYALRFEGLDDAMTDALLSLAAEDFGRTG